MYVDGSIIVKNTIYVKINKKQHVTHKEHIILGYFRELLRVFYRNRLRIEEFWKQCDSWTREALREGDIFLPPITFFLMKNCFIVNVSSFFKKALRVEHALEELLRTG